MSFTFTFPKTILSLLDDVILVKYFHVASLTLMAYDYLIMLPDEIQHIWTARWNWNIMPLYLLTRYLAFFEASVLTAFLFDPQLPVNNCATVYRVAAWFELVGIAVAEVVLLKRTYAIWGQSRKILYVLILLSTTLIPSAVVMEMDLSTLEFPLSPFPTIVPCISSGEKSILYIDYAILLGLESVVLSLTIWIGVKQWREKLDPLRTVLYRDAVTFSSILFVTSIANVTVLAGTSSIALHLLMLEPQRVLHSVLTSRIILHLRIASTDTEEKAETMPSMNFNQPDVSSNAEMTSAFSGDGAGTVSMFAEAEDQDGIVDSNPV